MSSAFRRPASRGQSNIWPLRLSPFLYNVFRSATTQSVDQSTPTRALVAPNCVRSTASCAPMSPWFDEGTRVGRRRSRCSGRHTERDGFLVPIDYDLLKVSGGGEKARFAVSKHFPLTRRWPDYQFRTILMLFPTVDWPFRAVLLVGQREAP